MLTAIATVLLVFLVLVLIGAVFGERISRPIVRTPAEVATYLRDFIEGTGGEWDWDDFEGLRIADPELDRIRREAMAVGPPNANMQRLRELLSEAEKLASR
jgi:hypothetical protein